MKTQYPALLALIEAYFHQDWAIEGRGTDEIVDVYLRENETGTALAAADEIDRLLSAQMTEADLRDVLLEQLGSGYDPYGEEISMREWLAHIGQRLRQAGSTEIDDGGGKWNR
jgi:hypothetical protein